MTASKIRIKKRSPSERLAFEDGVRYVLHMMLRLMRDQRPRATRETVVKLAEVHLATLDRETGKGD